MVSNQAVFGQPFWLLAGGTDYEACIAKQLSTRSLGRIEQNYSANSRVILSRAVSKEGRFFSWKICASIFFERPHGGAGLSLGVSYSWCFNPASNTSFHWDLLDFSLPSTVSSCLLCSVPRCLHYIWLMNLMHFFSKTSSFFGYLAAAQVTRTLLTVTPRKAREA